MRWRAIRNRSTTSFAHQGIRVSVIEPANTNTQFDANLLEPDAKLDTYREVRAAVGEGLKELIETADQPGVVADTVLKAAVAARPKLRYPAGARASRLQLLRRFAPAAPGGRRDQKESATRLRCPRRQRVLRRWRGKRSYIRRKIIMKAFIVDR